MIFGILLMLLFTVLPVIVIIMIGVAIAKRSKSSEGASSIKQFENSMRSIFTYIVLICLLCTIIGGTIYLFNSGLNLALPENSSNDYIDYYDYSLRRERNSNIVGILTSCSMLISCIPLFVYFNKVAKEDN